MYLSVLARQSFDPRSSVYNRCLSNYAMRRFIYSRALSPFVPTHASVMGPTELIFDTLS